MLILGKIIAVVNQKGGVGKTTTCVNTAAAIKELGKSVLLVDFDPQGNATSGFGVGRNNPKSMYDVVIGRCEAAEAIIETPFGDVLPSSKELSGAEIELINMPERESILRKVVEPLRERYDFIFIDSPPTLTLLTLLCLCAADSVLIPVQCEYYALEGLSDLMYTLKVVKKSLNPEIEIEGILLTMFDSRLNLSFQVAEEVKKYFPGQVMPVAIPRNVRLSEAPSFGVPVMHHDRASKGAECYAEVAKRLVKRQ